MLMCLFSLIPLCPDPGTNPTFVRALKASEPYVASLGTIADTSELSLPLRFGVEKLAV